MIKMQDNGSSTGLKVADLFAGAGGLSVGFHSAGFECGFFNEIDERAAATFGLNFPDTTAFVSPVEELSADWIRRGSDLGDEDLDVMVGGPPCQGFSINAPVRSEGDSRNHLFRHFARIVLEGIRPKFVLIENVPGLVSLDGGATLENVKLAFEQAGYKVIYKILNAAHYGAPQERWRLFFLGTRLPDVDLSFPLPTHYSTQRPNFTGGREHIFRHAISGGVQGGLFDDPLKPFINLEEAIGDLPSIPSGGGAGQMAYTNPPKSDYQRLMRVGTADLHNHECANMSEINLERMRHVKPGGSWRDIPLDLLPAGMRRAKRSDHTRRYGRLHPKRIVPHHNDQM